MNEEVESAGCADATGPRSDAREPVSERVSKALIGISIVNYRTAQLVEACLEALSNESDFWPCFRIVVVDNCSGDGSVEALRAQVKHNDWEAQVQIIESPVNGGFAHGNNLAFERLLMLDCRFIWLLNPDARPHPGATKPLVDCLEGNSAVAAVGSRLEDEDGTPQASAFNFPTPLGEFVNASRLGFLVETFPRARTVRPISTEPEFVDWVAGASMMLRKELLDEVGMMDAGFFLYFEEVDFCRAIHAAGHSIAYEPRSRVVHHVGAATGISDGRRQAPRRPVYWFESRQRYFQKNFGFRGTMLADLSWMLGFSVWRLKALLLRRETRDPPHFLSDFARNSSFSKGRVRS